MNFDAVFRLYDAEQPIRFETKETGHGDSDFRMVIFVWWQNKKLVIKLADNDFTDEARVAAWAAIIREYRAAGYYCPQIVKNQNGSDAARLFVDGRACTVYAEEFAKYRTAEQFEKSEITRNGRYVFLDDALRSIGVMGSRHLDTADFPSVYCILEKFCPSDPCDEVMENALSFKKTMEESFPQYLSRFEAIWRLYLENQKKLETVYPFLPTSVFQADLNHTNILLDEEGQFMGMLDFNLSGRDTVLNYLFRQIIILYDFWGNDMFYDREAAEKTTECFLDAIKTAGEVYAFSEQEKACAILVYRYLRPFWWRPAQQIEKEKANPVKAEQLLNWVERELTRDDIDFSGAMAWEAV